MREPHQKRLLTATGVMKPLHGEELAVDGIVRLIQHRAHRWHLGVGEHRIPPRFLGLKPAPHALAMLCAHRRGDAIGKVAEALAQCHDPQACTLATPVEQSMEFARRYGCALHILNSDHRLQDEVRFLKYLFEYFLVSLDLPQDVS